MLDELNAPLGQGDRKRQRFELPSLLPKVVAGVLGGFIIVFLGWTMFADAPFGGEPMAVAPADLHADHAEAADASGGPGHRYDGPLPNGGAPAAPAPAPAPAPHTITIIDGTNGKREEVVIPGQASDKGASQPADPRFYEPSPHGPVPRIAQDGTRPAEAFAQPVKAIPGGADAPKVAIVVSGLGISAATTSQALTELPGPVTLAFPPYGADLQNLAACARGGGHELLLQVPMEPLKYPDNDPGPQTLLTSLDSDKNLDRLQWLMSRMQGYVGIANYMGVRFTSNEQALAPILREIAKRGLIYVEDATVPRSVAGQLAGANNLPYAKTDVMIDAVPTEADIDRALARLEKTARERGFAVGMASALPASIEHIAKWAAQAQSQGIQLVPITAVAARAKSS